MRPSIHGWLAMALMLLISPIGAAAAPKPDWLLAVEKAVEEARTSRGFNGSIALGLANQPVKIFTAGEFQENTPLNAEHLFSSGSVGKEFTTAALLKLQQEGKLTLDDPITEYLASLPDWANSITIQHLLSHTSGLPKIQWKKGIVTEDVMSQVSALAALAFEPGSGYLYGNINVTLRAKIVESIAGVTFERYLHTAFFEPLNMKNTQQLTQIGPRQNIVGGDHPSGINGVTLYTTPSDLVRWETALLDGRVLSGSPVTAFLNLHPLSEKQHHAEYDFGHFYQNAEGVSAIKHDGSNPSHHVLKFTDLEQRFTFVAMSNDGDKSTLYRLKDAISALVINRHSNAFAVAGQASSPNAALNN